MFLSAHDKKTKMLAQKAEVIDKNTGEKIPKVIWANDKTGRYRRYLTDENGSLIIDHEKGELMSKIFTGDIEIRFRKTENND